MFLRTCAVWRQRADWLYEPGASDAARSWRTAARELEEALKAHGEQTYSLGNTPVQLLH